MNFLIPALEYNTTPLEELVQTAYFMGAIRSKVSNIPGYCSSTGGIPWRWHVNVTEDSHIIGPPGPDSFVSYYRYKAGYPSITTTDLTYSYTVDVTKSILNVLGLSTVYTETNRVLEATNFIGNDGSNPACNDAAENEWKIPCDIPHCWKNTPLTNGSMYDVDSIQSALKVNCDKLARSMQVRKVLSYTAMEMVANVLSVGGGLFGLVNFLFPVIVVGQSGRFFRFGHRRDVVQTLFGKKED